MRWSVAFFALQQGLFMRHRPDRGPLKGSKPRESQEILPLFCGLHACTLATEDRATSSLGYHTPYAKPPLPCHFTDQTACLHPFEAALNGRAAHFNQCLGHWSRDARPFGQDSARPPSVLPESKVISVSARTDHATISSRCLIGVRHANCIPSSRRAKRSAGGPPTRSPIAPTVNRGANSLPLPWPAANRAAVTAASIRSPYRQKPERLQR